MTPLLTLVLPYYNEEKYIKATLESLGAQTSTLFQVVLIDNGSTDRSTETAREVTRHWTHLKVEYRREETPGKIHALVTGLHAPQTKYVATCDADTLYPPHYVSTILTLFEKNPEASSVIAIGLKGSPSSWRGKFHRQKILLASQIFSGKCHGGGFSHAFRTEIYEKSGGYNPALWNYVLEDHEILHRIMRYGKSVYDKEHYCFTSNRRQDRKNVDWNAFERLFYTFLPFPFLGWYFNRFLSPRFEKKGFKNTNLREKTWELP